MSNALRELAWQTNLPPMERFILVAMADHANADGIAWPSVARLSERTGATERTVYRAMKVLRDEGHISQVSAPRAQTTARYRVHPCQDVSPDTVSALTECQRDLTDCHPTPDTVSAEPCHSVTQTVIEPSLNLQEPGAPAAKPKRAKGSPKIAMADDWQPSPLPEDLAKLVSIWPADREQRELREFREFWIERGDRRPGWDRTWRQWIGRIHDRVMKDGAGYRREAQAPATDTNAFVQRMERHQAQRAHSVS